MLPIYVCRFFFKMDPPKPFPIMDPPKPFPIIRLPFLAIEEIFKAMDPIEIINFSMISKRTKGIAKQMSFYPKYKIELYINETLEIRFHGTNDVVSCFYVMASNKYMDGKIVEEAFGQNITRRVFKYDPFDEWKHLFKYCHLFHAEERNDVDRHTAYLLDNITIISELGLDVYNNDDFNGNIPKNLQELRINNSKWVGYEKLLEIDCKSVILEKNRILNKQWNLFVKKWMAMETNQNLEHLKLDYRDLEEFRALVLYDIPHEVVDGAVERILKT
ncbi:hypothetical protein CRE_19627 [Caenorhabditis remanei]|uniref:F-box domain-containing protein n=1 Tax=Caenorhabditis remanei TaxID=31234 RepID=E3NVK7_CAERE|nr:hypothetical protein CRE_19627 [Caenorhabditis remanei]